MNEPPAPVPAVLKPQFLVDDNAVKASVSTVVSLIFFGITLFCALLRLASAGDLNAIRALLLRDDTLGWISTVIVTAAPTFWLIWRPVRAWIKTKIVAAIADTSPVAMRKSEIAPPPVWPETIVAKVRAPVPPLDLSGYPPPARPDRGVVPPPPTRARETTTRLVSADALYPGTPVAPSGRPIMAAPVTPFFSPDIFQPGQQVEVTGPDGTKWSVGIGVSHDPLPHVDKIETPAPENEAKANPDADRIERFTAMFDQWKAGDQLQPFDEYAVMNGWEYDSAMGNWKEAN